MSDWREQLRRGILDMLSPPDSYDQNTAPEDLKPVYSALDEEPDRGYGTILPFSYNKEDSEAFKQRGWEPRFSLPSVLRDAAKGTVDAIAAVKTGQLTPTGAAAVGLGGVGAGSIYGPAGSLASGAAKLVDKKGLAVKGKDFTKRSQQVLKEINEGPAGAGPLDLSRPSNVQVEQKPLPRYAPPRGISPRLQDALGNKQVIDGIRASIERGMELGADKWYHNNPILEAFVQELGDDTGRRSFKEYMDYVAATSPRSDVSTNIRNASYYYANSQKGVEKPLPYPYGHVAQNLHIQNAERIRADGGWDVYKNPKPASFSENLQGNLEPGTIDTHAFRNIGMRTKDPRFLETSISQPFKGTAADLSTLEPEQAALLSMAQRLGEISSDGKKVVFRPQKLLKEGKMSMEDALNTPAFWSSKPNENEYAAAEALYKQLGSEFKLPTADAQAAAWSGAGDLTGLASPATKTFPQLFNERVLYTAKMRGEDPQETLRAFIRKERPLLSVATPVGAPQPEGRRLPAGLLDDPVY
jgi:hypothetical protein